MILKKSTRDIFFDARFILAILAGPVVWLALYIIGGTINFFRLPLVDYFLPVLLYPVLEEWVFRGNLQPAITQKFPKNIPLVPLSLANSLTSLIFAGLHLFSHPPLWALSVILPSLIFGWASERYNTLAAPIILHVFYNAGYFLLFA